MANFIKLTPVSEKYTEGRSDDRLLMVSSVVDREADQAEVVEALGYLGIGGGGAALTFAGSDPNGETILAARIVGGLHDGMILPAQGTDYGNGKEVFALDYVTSPITFINWGTTRFTFYFNTFTVASSSIATGTTYPWEADWTGAGFDVVEDAVTAAGLSATHLGQWCKATTAWWQWDGTAWIPRFTLAGDPIAYNATLAAFRKLVVSGADGSEIITISTL